MTFTHSHIDIQFLLTGWLFAVMNYDEEGYPIEDELWEEDEDLEDDEDFADLEEDEELDEEDEDEDNDDWE